MPIHPNSDIQAEEFRRKHCDSPERYHQCVGVITLKPGMCLFDCKLCGQDFLSLEKAMDLLDSRERNENV